MHGKCPAHQEGERSEGATCPSKQGGGMGHATHSGHEGHGTEGCEKPQQTVADDPEAKALLRGAFEKTARWGTDFPGFSADLVVNNDGAVYKGKVLVKSIKETDVSLDTGSTQAEGELLAWVQNQVGMMAAHRAPRAFEDADGKHAITFADQDTSHPLGRQICIHDGISSRYRIKDNRILQISRDMGRIRFTINIEDSMRTDDGTFLTTQYVVYYFSPDGKLSQVESFTDQPAVVNKICLPGTRRVILTNEGRVIVRVMEFTNHQWL